MVFKRKYTRPTYGRRTKARAAKTIQGAFRKKRATRMKFGATKSLNYRGIHYFKDKTTDEVVLRANAGTSTWTGFTEFTISSLSNLSNYVNLFDSYQIKGVKVKFFPVSQVPTPLTSTGANPQGSMQLCLKPEYNDDVPWPSYSASLQTDPKVHAFGDYPKSIYLNPRPRVGVVEDPGQPIANANWVTAQSQKRDQMWLSTADNLTRHYGLKSCVHNVPVAPAPGQEARMVVVTTYYLAFKDQK